VYIVAIDKLIKKEFRLLSLEKKMKKNNPEKKEIEI